MPSTRIVTEEWACGREMKPIEGVQSALLGPITIPGWGRDGIVTAAGRRLAVLRAGRVSALHLFEDEPFARSLTNAIIRLVADVSAGWLDTLDKEDVLLVSAKFSSVK